jgi:hypothetical protein
MLDLAGIDLDRPNGFQRRTLNLAVRKIFGSEKKLDRFLDENLDLRLNEVSSDGAFPDRIWEMILELQARGWLRRFVEALAASPEYRDSPWLRDLRDTWHLQPGTAAVQAAQPSRPGPGAADTGSEGLERVVEGHGQLNPGASLKRLAELSHAVCTLRAGAAGATGFLVAPDLVLTAAYVLQGLRATDLTARFDAATELAEAEVAVTGVVLSDPDPIPAKGHDAFFATLDFAVLRLAQAVSDRRAPYRLDRTRQRLTVGEEVVMFHHPGLGALATSRGRVVGGSPETNRLHHDCPTAPGSGGAPLFDTQLRLIGLNEAGTAGYNIAVRADRIAAALADGKVL